MTEPLQTFTSSFDECRTSVCRRPILGSGGCCCCCPDPRSLFYYHLVKKKSDTRFTISWKVEGWVDLGTAVRMSSSWLTQWAQLYVDCGEIQTWDLSTAVKHVADSWLWRHKNVLS